MSFSLSGGDVVCEVNVLGGRSAQRLEQSAPSADHVGDAACSVSLKLHSAPAAHIHFVAALVEDENTRLGGGRPIVVPAGIQVRGHEVRKHDAGSAQTGDFTLHH